MTDFTNLTLVWHEGSRSLAAAEAHAMEEPEIAKSNSPSVLGTLNQFAYIVEGDLYYGKASSAAELTQRLTDMVVTMPKNIHFPADRVREAFGMTPTSPLLRAPSGTVVH